VGHSIRSLSGETPSFRWIDKARASIVLRGSRSISEISAKLRCSRRSGSNSSSVLVRPAAFSSEVGSAWIGRSGSCGSSGRSVEGSLGGAIVQASSHGEDGAMRRARDSPSCVLMCPVGGTPSKFLPTGR
jgi:hypothetical protein